MHERRCKSSTRLTSGRRQRKEDLFPPRSQDTGFLEVETYEAFGKMDNAIRSMVAGMSPELKQIFAEQMRAEGLDPKEYL